MNKWKELIRILLLEDNPDDVELLKIALKRSQLEYEINRISTERELKKEDFENYDLILSDYNLGGYDGVSAIKWIRSNDLVIPIILVSGTVGEELAIEVMHAGANDFVLKSNLKKLPMAISRVLTESRMYREKNRFQQELLNQKMVLNAIFDSFESIIFLKDEQGKYVKVNLAFCKYLERTPEEIIGKDESELFPDWISEKGLKNDEYVYLTGKPVVYEIDQIDQLGHRTVLEVTKTPLLNGGKVTAIVGQSRDITEKKILAESKEKAQSILNQAEQFTRSGSFEYDADLDIISCSPNFMRMMNLNVQGDAISLRKLAMLVKKEERQLFTEGISKAIESRTEYNSEHRFDLSGKEDDIYGHFRIVIKPDYRNGKGTKFYGTVLDVTAEQQSHVYLMNKQEEERKDIARDLHDNLGQKLNGVSMFLSKISENQPDNKDLTKVKEILHETIDTLGFIISSISVKHMEEHSLQYSMDKLLDYLPQGIEVESDINIDEKKLSPFIKTQLYRVMQEVFNNAMKYSQASKMKMKVDQNGAVVHMAIEDNGKGFCVQDVLDGHGLQNITYRVRHSNGLIHIDSKEGKGTKVQVRLPIN